MGFFNLSYRKKLNDFLLTKSNSYRAIKVYGNLGCGKTYATTEILQDNGIAYQIVTFSTYNIVPFQNIKNQWAGSEEDQFLMKFSKLFQEGCVLVFENLERCGQDQLRLIARLLQYHKNSGEQTTAILEYDESTSSCDCLSELVQDRVFVEPIKKDEFLSYLQANFLYNKKNEQLFNKIIIISNKNLQNFFITLNILKQQDIICGGDGQLLYYNKPEEALPNNLLSLYGKLLEGLDGYLQNSLQAAVPFAPNIYTHILKIIIQNFDNFEKYLEELSQFDSLIRVNKCNDKNEDSIFQSSYLFTTEAASEAVCNKLSSKQINDLTRRYYDYLDKIYHNTNEYNLLSNSDKMQLLMNLTQSRKGYIKINQIPLIIDIMIHYYEHFLYFSAIEYGNKIIEAKILNPEQMNMKFHEFYLVYFRTLLAVGDYKCIMEFKGQFTDEDINFLIARAFYNSGKPRVALHILDNIDKNKNKINRGYKEHLKASIYDWIGDHNKSLEHFKRALKTSASEDSLKYQLYKKYGMYVDFRLPECKQKIKQAVEFYEYKDLKQFAECLHNYGTGCVMTFQFEEAKENLERSRTILSKICNEEVYYPLNSLAILYCIHSKDFDSAVEIWNDALKYHIVIDFCNLALQNNRFNAYIHQKNWYAAQKQKIDLEATFYEICPRMDFAKELMGIRPDLQHQLRQFYYNCAVFHKVKREFLEALKYFIMAEKSSKYNSTLVYAISRNIRELEKICYPKAYWRMYWKKPLLHPSMIEEFMYEHDMYLCETMFWG